MTASAQLRRRYTQQAAVAVAVSFTLSIILAIVGARTLASSTIGSKAGGDQGETVIALPETTTAFIGVVDDDGTLQSAALIVLDPSGVGGAVVPFEAAADISARDQRRGVRRRHVHADRGHRSRLPHAPRLPEALRGPQ